MGISTLAEETAALTGGDWAQKQKQRAKEHRLRVADGLESAIAAPKTVTPTPIKFDEPIDPEE